MRLFFALSLLLIGFLAGCSGAKTAVNPDSNPSIAASTPTPSDPTPADPPPSNTPPSNPPASNPPPSTPPPVTVSVLPAIATISTSQTQQFTATLQNTGNSSVSWQVDGIQSGNATVGTISAAGLYSPSQ